MKKGCQQNIVAAERVLCRKSQESECDMMHIPADNVLITDISAMLMHQSCHDVLNSNGPTILILNH